MTKKNVVIIFFLLLGVSMLVLRCRKNNYTYKIEIINPIQIRKMKFYEKYVKRILDVICALAAIVCFSPLYIIIAILVRIKLGHPIIFKQDRPGLVDVDGRERVFKMYKFRTMTDQRDKNGKLLPDEARLTKFGVWLRKTSLDELPEAFNILNGTMSVIGPRPQLVRDLVFMSDEQRIRHTAKPGLSGLAQVNGRNAITWEEKLKWDIKYVEKVSFIEDVSIVLHTVRKALLKREGISQDNMATAEDFGDYLMNTKKISEKEYHKKQEIVRNIENLKKGKEIIDEEIKRIEDSAVSNIKYSVLMSLYIKEKPEYLDEAIKSIIQQSLKPDEIVIVKDGNISKELQEILDKYVKLYPNLFNIIGYEKNRGLGLALNYGLEYCKNELVARMDTDDIAKPDRCLKEVKAFLLHPDYAVIGSAVDEFYYSTEKITGRRVVPSQPEDIYNFAKRRSAFNHPSVMFRKSKVLEFGGYADLRRNQDVDLFGRMEFGGCKSANFKESLLWFRSDENLAKRRKSWENSWSYIDTIRRFWNMGYSKLSDVIVVSIAQILMYLMPIRLQNWIYKTFLRK